MPGCQPAYSLQHGLRHYSSDKPDGRKTGIASFNNGGYVTTSMDDFVGCAAAGRTHLTLLFLNLLIKENAAKLSCHMPTLLLCPSKAVLIKWLEAIKKAFTEITPVVAHDDHPPEGGSGQS